MGFFCSMFSCFSCSKGNRKEEERKEKWRVFSFKELLAATHSFNYDNMLGDGEFGCLYWGQLWDGSQIAVRRFKDGGDRDERLFTINIEILGRVRHKNLLSLRGYCAEGKEHLVVYDYMPNLSLLSHLRGHFAECLDWEKRMNIAIGAAEGIAYLHHHATPNMLHGDIKASNVLLDSNFWAQVADFGFAKLIPNRGTHDINDLKCTHGYLAPEYLLHGKVSKGTDIYSFGILLLELVSGKKPIEKLSATTKRTITDWALPLVRERKFSEMVDQRLDGKYIEDELRRVVLVAVLCSQNQPQKRPTMLEVLDLLKDASLEKLSDIQL